MKTSLRSLATLLLGSSLMATAANAQRASIQFFRPYDQTGINMFEPSKADTVPYKGVDVRIGGAFSQDFQALDHENTPDTSKTNKLVNLTNGFNLAMANLFLDAQLADGVRANVTVYLSSRHHSESWVKGGYMQIDKMPFFHSAALDDIMKNFTIKLGHFEVDYGDQHYRRSDGGNVMHNPFVENYIMDPFATEIGGEIYYHPISSPFLAMVGVTNGMLNPTVVAAANIDAADNDTNSFGPAVHAKLGFDSQIDKDLRVRLTGSMYWVGSTSRSTLYAGDRTGSHYFLVMENTSATTSANATSGRFSPNFTDEVMSIMVNPFIKYQGLEFFGTFETSSGRTVTEVDKRKATQIAADLLFRFGPEENFWVGGRFNTVKAEMAAKTPYEVTINRMVGSLGWFITPSIMMKLEYVTQDYNDFLPNDIRNGGKFNGLVVEAGLGF
jgi:hypothetical protein